MESQQKAMAGAIPRGAAVFDEAARPRIHDVYADLRENEPISRLPTPDGRSIWFVSRFEDANAVLKDHRRFGNDPGQIHTEEELEAFYAKVLGHLSEEEIAEIKEVDESIGRQLLGVDPPDHTRLRKLVSRSFTPKYVEEMRPRVQAIADGLLEEMAARFAAGERTVDLVDAYAFPLPLTVIAEMLGVPMSMREKFRAWSTAAVAFNPAEPGNMELNGQLLEFVRYIRELIAEKREHPADDLMSALVQDEEEGDRLSEHELIAMAFLLIVAGHETTANLIGNAMLAFFERPDQLALLKADPGLAKQAVEEALRYCGPVQHTLSRWVREDLEFGGQRMAKGEQVIVLLAAADRDPRQFADPDRFDITREPGRHLAFGTGIHVCLGAPLARLEGQIALVSLLERFPDLRMAISASDVRWRPGSLVRGVEELPVSIGA